MLCEMKGIDVNVQDKEGNTPLMLASQGGNIQILLMMQLVASFETRAALIVSQDSILDSNDLLECRPQATPLW